MSVEAKGEAEQRRPKISEKYSADFGDSGSDDRGGASLFFDDDDDNDGGGSLGQRVARLKAKMFAASAAASASAEAAVESLKKQRTR